jgi:hypothetical protein
MLLLAGFVVEFTFRGVIQAAAVARLGSAGLRFAAALFAILHIPVLTPGSVPTGFAEGLILGWAVFATGSIVGVRLNLGVANIVASLVLPALLEQDALAPPTPATPAQIVVTLPVSSVASGAPPAEATPEAARDRLAPSLPGSTASLIQRFHSGGSDLARAEERERTVARRRIGPVWRMLQMPFGGNGCFSTRLLRQCSRD